MRTALSLFAVLATSLALLPALTHAHGYLSSPPPRGSQKVSYQIDDLKSPNRRGLCRGEPEGPRTKVRPGENLTLGLTITAPHVGPCRVTILDADLKNERPVASKFNCAAPGKVEPWVVKLPSDVRGHMVLRWYWEGQHVSPGEPYEQCIDLEFGEGGGSDAPKYTGKRDDRKQDESDKPRRRQMSKMASAPVDPTGAAAHHGEPAHPSAQPSTPANAAPGVNGAGGEDRAAPPASEHVTAAHATAPAGSCAAGSYKCNRDGGFSQCANGSWVAMGCATGTACRETSPTAIVCDRAADATPANAHSLDTASPQETAAEEPEEEEEEA